MFICVFQAPRRPPKEGKQKHLFTPLLSRRDLEGGSVFGAAIPLEKAPDSLQCRGQLVHGALSVCVIVCYCDRRAHDGDSERSKAHRQEARSGTESSPFAIFSLLVMVVRCCVSPVGRDGASRKRGRLVIPSLLHGYFATRSYIPSRHIFFS